MTTRDLRRQLEKARDDERKRRIQDSRSSAAAEREARTHAVVMRALGDAASANFEFGNESKYQVWAREYWRPVARVLRDDLHWNTLEQVTPPAGLAFQTAHELMSQLLRDPHWQGLEEEVSNAAMQLEEFLISKPTAGNVVGLFEYFRFLAHWIVTSQWGEVANENAWYAGEWSERDVDTRRTQSPWGAASDVGHVRQWKGICGALGEEVTRSLRDRLKSLNQMSAGPIRYDGRVPTASESQLLVWRAEMRKRHQWFVESRPMRPLVRKCSDGPAVDD